MAVTTASKSHVHTQTATHLTDVIMGSIGDILALLGIDTSRFWADFDQDERAISAWIEEESLKEVILECHRPNGTVRPVFEFPIRYDSDGVGNAGFVDSRAAFARYQAKIASVPSGTRYRLFCTYRKTHTPQTGWGPGTRASTEGLRSTSFGSIASAPGGGAGMRYLN